MTPATLAIPRSTGASAFWPGASLPVRSVLLWCLPALVVFLNSADFRGATGDQGFEVHWQILMRLALTGLCGTVGALCLFPSTYRDFLTWPGFLVTIEFALYGMSQLFSVSPSYSMAAWVCYGCIALLVPAAMRQIGEVQYLTSLLVGCAVYLTGSWIAFLYFPEIGIHHEFVSMTEHVERMGGLGHPNETGLIAVFTLVLASSMARASNLRWEIAALVIALAGVTLVACFSRTSMICSGLALMYVFRNDLFRMGNAVVLTVLVTLSLPAVFVLVGTGNLDWLLEDVAARFTKSGNMDELTTFTGRTEIWAAAFDLISQSPIGGYGYASTRFVMEEFSFHAHNTVLNATLYAGLAGGGVVVAMFLVMIHGAVFRPKPMIDGLAVVMLIAGLVEGMLGQPSPGLTTVLWLTLIFWRQIYPDTGD